MEASARKKKRPLAAIPENLEELSQAGAHQDHPVIAAASGKEAQGR